jgi:hypothetical protein
MAGEEKRAYRIRKQAEAGAASQEASMEASRAAGDDPNHDKDRTEDVIGNAPRRGVHAGVHASKHYGQTFRGSRSNELPVPLPVAAAAAATAAAAAAAAADSKPTLPSSEAIDTEMRSMMYQLDAMSPPPVVLTWPITALSGWGTAGRAVVREMIRGEIATPILLAPLPDTAVEGSVEGSADLRLEFSALELEALRRSQRIMRRVLELQVAARLVDRDAALLRSSVNDASPLEIVAPMPVFHAVGNGFSSSAAGMAPPVRWGHRAWNLALKGSPNVGIVFMEDTTAGLKNASWVAAVGRGYQVMIAGSTWTLDVLTHHFAEIEGSIPGGGDGGVHAGVHYGQRVRGGDRQSPRMSLVYQGVDPVAFPLAPMKVSLHPTPYHYNLNTRLQTRINILSCLDLGVSESYTLDP